MNASILATNPENFIFASSDDLRTNSLKIAEAFEKQHKDVLRVIDRIISQVSDSFGQRNFAPSSYINEQSKEQRMFELTKDGFIMVVMSFTGEKAMQIKEAYINAFNLMHAKLFPKRNGLVDLPPATPKTITPAMQRQVQKAISHLVKTQVGTTYSGLYGQIKDKFGVGTYKDVPFKQYGELCAFLNIEPIIEQADMVALSEFETLDPNQKVVQVRSGQIIKMEDFIEQIFQDPNHPYVMVKRDAMTAIRTLFNGLF